MSIFAMAFELNGRPTPQVPEASVPPSHSASPKAAESKAQALLPERIEQQLAAPPAGQQLLLLASGDWVFPSCPLTYADVYF